jgi:carbon monoxide dehydrogenase subunit G
MAKLVHQIKINVAPEKVWDALSNLETIKYYNPLVSSVKYISSNKEGIGASRRCDFKPSGYAKERIIGWEPKSSITMELYESGWPIKRMWWETSLIPDGNGTMLSQYTEYEIKFGFLGKLMDSMMMNRKFKSIIEETLQNLKTKLEQGIL